MPRLPLPTVYHLNPNWSDSVVLLPPQFKRPMSSLRVLAKVIADNPGMYYFL